MRKKILLLLCVLCQAVAGMAQWDIQEDKTYYMRCDYTTGFIGLSSAQGQAEGSYVLYQQDGDAPTEDAYWQITPVDGAFTFQNTSTGQYLSYSDDYSNLRNLSLVDEYVDGNQLWTIVPYGGGVNIISYSNPGKCFHMRSTRLVALYSSTTDPKSIFHIYDQDGVEIVYTDDGSGGDGSNENVVVWDSTKRYHICNSNEFGYMVYDPEFDTEKPSLRGYCNWTTHSPAYELFSLEADLSSENSQWTFSYDEAGNCYVYNVGRAAYLGYNSGHCFVDEPEAVEVTDLGNGTYAFRMKANKGDDRSYLCAAPQQSYRPVATWTSDDMGCSWIVSEITEIPSDPSADVVVVDGYNSSVRWDGGEESHLFPIWTSSNANVAGSTSSYTVDFTIEEEGGYQLSFAWTASINSSATTFSATLDGAQIMDNVTSNASGLFDQSFTLTPGEHSLVFTYAKEAGDVANGESLDRAHIRKLTLKRNKLIESISLSASNISPLPGEWVQIYTSISPSDAFNQNLLWETDNENFQVYNGEVYVNGYGTATITATAQDGSGVSASITISAVDETETPDTPDNPFIFDPSIRYYIYNTNNFGYMVYDPQASEEKPSLRGNSNTESSCHQPSNDLYVLDPDYSSANSQWRIFQDDSGYCYLYNIGRKAYLSSNRRFTAEAQSFEILDLGGNAFAFRPTGSTSSSYICAAPQFNITSGSSPITTWSSNDVGCTWMVSEASEITSGEVDDDVIVDGYNSSISREVPTRSSTNIPGWVSGNLGEPGTTSSYTVEFITEQDVYLLEFGWSTLIFGGAEFSITLDGEYIVDPQSGIASAQYSNEHFLSAGTHTLVFTYTKAEDNTYCEQALVNDFVITHIPKVKSLSLQAPEGILKPGDEVQLQAVITPEYAVNKNLTWSSSNAEFSITQNGLLTIHNYGTATITASTQDGSALSASLTLNVVDAYMPYGKEMLYLRHADSTVTVIPQDHLDTCNHSGSLFTATFVNQKNIEIKGIVDVSTTAPADIPSFHTYKFNNKFNPQIFTDAETLTPQADTINLSVAGIGKWLTASFKLADPATEVYAKGKRQKSKYSRMSFADPIMYRITNPKWSILRLRHDGDTANYTLETSAFEREQLVKVTFLTDHSTNEYKVPRIDITLTNNPYEWSSENWIGMNGKRTYEEASIKIQGGGVFPDMDSTRIQIKGRGNSSWSGSSSSKNPYHFKFDVKQKPLGMTAGKHWILLANKIGGSMTTNAVGMKAANIFETAGNNHIVPVELYINGSYRGSYNLTERVGFSNNSIDLTDETCAAMLELDTYSDETIYTSNAYGVSTKVHIPDDDDMAEGKTSLTYDEIIADYDNMMEMLAAGGDEFTKAVDAEYLARYLSAAELIWHEELKHPKSVFLYSENVTDGFSIDSCDATPWIFGPLWDCDWAFGYDNTWQYFNPEMIEADFFGELRSYNGGFWYDLRYNSQEVDSIYYSLWYNLNERGIVQELHDYVQEYYDFAKASLEHNSQNETSNTDGRDYAAITQRSQEWITQRFNHIFNSLTPYNLPAEEEDNETGAPERDVMGDVNDDGAVTTADVVTLLNEMLGLPTETYISSRADIDSNGRISMGDVVLLCNLAMHKTYSIRRQLHLPAATMHLYAKNATLQSYDEGIANLIVEVDEGKYSALQMDVELPVGVELTGVVLPEELADMSAKFQLLENGLYRLMLYADGGFALPTTAVTLGLRLSTGEAQNGRISISSPTAVSSLGEEERIAASSAKLLILDATGLEAIHKAQGTTDNAPLYDLSGRRVYAPQKGCIYVKNGKKIIVK